MPIQENNIQFLESQVMDDVPEGGGAATGRVIVDGKMNNIYEDVSDLDRALGRFNLRKIFLAVRSVSTDLYGGAKSVITQLPTDAALGFTLFTTNNPFDTRLEAANRVEAYLFKGPMWHGALHENHITGMQAINVIQRVGTELAPIGKTLCLVQNEGLGTEKEQYVRVTDVNAVETTFTDSQGDYTRWIVTMSLSDALLHDFTGHTVNRNDSYNYTTGVRLRNTTVADAQRYFGSQRLQQAASIGDLAIKAESQFTQLVPSARTETPLVNQPLNPELLQTLSGGTRTVTVPQQAHTRALAVTAENRRLNWIETLTPRPATLTLSVAYMAQGNWFVLTDDGAGIVAGSDPGYGAGTVNYTTGSLSVTLGALPDTGSQIMITWASPVHYDARPDDPDIDAKIKILHSVGEPITPGTLVLTWLVGGIQKTANGAVSGQITGDATGYVSHVVGEFRIEFTTPPDFNSLLGIDYEKQTLVQQQLTGVSAPGGVAALNLGAAIEPGTLELHWSTQSTRRFDYSSSRYRYRKVAGVWQYVMQERSITSQATARYNHVAADDGAGGIIDAGGSVNYATGEITAPLLPAISQYSYDYTNATWDYSQSANHEFVTGIVDAYYVPAGAASTVVSTEIAVPDLQFRILPRLLDGFVVPNSVRFTWNGETYDDQNGTLIRSGNITAGSIDYLSGIVTLSDYVTGAGNVDVTSLLIRYGDWSTIRASFRAQLSPLAPESVSIVAVTEDGEQITGSSDENGAINGAYMSGSVNYEFGTAEVSFGNDPGGGWVDRPVDPGTITYNAVSYSYIPLDANILGINAVRLPPDGRVPIYRAGDVVMIMHRLETAPQTIADGGVIDCGRTRIAWVRVLDALGATVSGTLYTLDRANGIVTFPDVSTITMPITVQHTIGDLRLVTDAQITGDLTLARALTHNFPANDTIVASCLVHGDRRARVSAVWDQASWDGTWKDTIVGSAATATLNTIDFPITVTNEACDTDRWVFRVTNAGSNQWELISEKRGLVWSGTYSPGGADVAPINPRTRLWDEPSQTWMGGLPYMTIPGDANGGGWATGNVVRINTVGAIVDLWVARSIAQSDPPEDDGVDGMEIYALGNINNPVGE